MIVCGIFVWLLALMPYSVQAVSLDNPSKTQIQKELIHLKKELKKKNSVQTNLRIGELHLKLNEFDDAIRYLRAASSSPSEKSLKLLALAYNGKKDFTNALRTLESLVQRSPQDPEAHELLGNAFSANKKLDKAAASYRKSIELNPARKTPYHGLLKLFVKSKNNYETRLILNDMIKKFGDDAHLQSELCRTFTEDSYFEEANTACLKAIQLDPKIPENHVYLGKIYRQTKNETVATRILIKAAKQFPNSELAQLSAGEVHDEQKAWETSVHYYRSCTKSNAQSLICWQKLGNALFALKDYKPALVAYFNACKIKPTDIVDFQRSTSRLRIIKENKMAASYQQEINRCRVGKPKEFD